MAVTVSSTSDTQEQVDLAAGLDAGTQESAGAEEQPSKEEKAGARREDDGAESSTASAAGKSGKSKTGTEEGESDGEVEEQAGRGSGKRGIEKKFSKLTRENRELRERLEAVERGGKQATTQTEKPKTEEADPEPQANDAKYARSATPYEDWIADRTRWTTRQEHSRLNAEDAQRRTAAEQNERLRQTFSEHVARVAEARETIEDWDDVVTNGREVNIPESAQVAIVESPLSAHIIHHLYKNPDAARKLFDMTAARQATYIGRLEEQIEAKLPKPEGGAEGEGGGAAAGASGKDSSTVAKPVTKAPPPVTPVGSSGNKGAPDPSEMSMADYRKARRSGQIA